MIERNVASHFTLVVVVLLGAFLYVGWRLRQGTPPAPLPTSGAAEEEKDAPLQARLPRDDGFEASLEVSPSEPIPAPPADVPDDPLAEADEENGLLPLPPILPLETSAPEPGPLGGGSLSDEERVSSGEDLLARASVPPPSHSPLTYGEPEPLAPEPLPAPNGLEADDGFFVEPDRSTASPAAEASETASVPSSSAVVEDTPPSAEPSGAAAAAPTTREVLVRRGDTLSRISARVLGKASRWREILQANEDVLDDPRSLRPGMKLRVPGAEAASSTTASEDDALRSRAVVHRVQSGESLISIAARYYGGRTSRDLVDLLRRTNAGVLQGSDMLRPGMRLTIPPEPTRSRAAPPSEETKTYRIRPGDTLSSVAKRFYGTPGAWRKLYDANRDRLAGPDRLRVGQVIRVPPPLR